MELNSNRVVDLVDLIGIPKRTAHGALLTRSVTRITQFQSAHHSKNMTPRII